MESILGLILTIISFAAGLWVLNNVWFVNRSLSTPAKIAWSIAAFFFNILTAIVYYFVERPKVAV